jgi:hypothetical protein
MLCMADMIMSLPAEIWQIMWLPVYRGKQQEGNVTLNLEDDLLACVMPYQHVDVTCVGQFESTADAGYILVPHQMI